jgi:DUF1680 family protein
MLDKAGNFVDLKLAAAGKREDYRGLLFTDSDLYKVLEGCAYVLAAKPNEKLESKLDAIIADIAAAQRPDGYINTWHQVTRPDKAFTNLRDWHELYCAGHLFEAAAAHFAATGKRNLLDVAVKFAELIDTKFGKSGASGYCGHPEIELALVKLWKATGEKRWFDLAKRMLDNRGTGYFAREHGTPPSAYDGTYWLDDVRLRDHKDIKGHAVRAAYLMSGAADVAREVNEPGILAMLKRLWRSAVERRIFVTGGIGPSASNEGFTVDYDLPNASAYQETCASIAMAMWGHRMALLFADAKYMDAVETSLYNAVLSGVSLDGKSFFYVNPLASDGQHRRSEWFECACCPPNILRTIATIGGYAYATTADSLYVNLYLGGSAKMRIGEQSAAIDVDTDYPWDGKVVIKVQQPAAFSLRLRRPDWCERVELSVNGKHESATSEKGYMVLQRDWKRGDSVTLQMEMPVRQLEAHPLVKENLGRLAVQRGPIVYCIEQVDNDVAVDEIVIPRGAKFKVSRQRNLQDVVSVTTADAEQMQFPNWTGSLYKPLGGAHKVSATLIPYGYWNNRAPGKMLVWIPSAPIPPNSFGPESHAEVNVSFANANSSPKGINDGVEPHSSGEQPAALCHFWPHKGGEEWVQYSWKGPQKVSGVQVYWFDDTGRGECRLPKSWKVQTLKQGKWVNVAMQNAPMALDKWCEAAFSTPLVTTALRLLVAQQDGWASGIHEWKVMADTDES